MKLKTKYQYTYFLYPYVIKEERYEKYIYQLLNNKHCKPRFFTKEKDLELYTYFLPSIRKFMFQGFSYISEKQRNLEILKKDMQGKILAKEPCMMFEYNLGQGMQGKAGEENGIFFKIQKIELICFYTGICFMIIKTHVEDSDDFSDILNFNYKFREINSELTSLKEYENIRLQSTTFADVRKLNEIITEVTGKETDTKTVDLDTNRFYTYAYTCIEQEDWNEEKEFKNLSSEFYKYANILPSHHKANFEERNIPMVEKWKFSKIATHKQGTTLLTSGIEVENYTILPHKFETEYLYTCILTQYQKIYLKKLDKQLKKAMQGMNAREDFIQFTNKLWIQEITNDDIGTELYKKFQKVTEVDKLYNELKNIYDIAYKESNIEKDTKINKVILIALIISILINIINFIALMRLQ